MFNLFGKKQAPAQNSAAPMTPSQPPVDTIKLLRDNLIVLEKREEHINKKIEAALEEAKLKSQKKDKNGALFALKRKKMYEDEVAKLQGARITLDSQILALESAAVNLETFKAMKAGAGAMKNMRGNIDADKVDEMMDDIQDERDIHGQISEAISRPGQDLFDDEDLLAELNELNDLSVSEEETVSAPAARTTVPQSVFSLPNVPTSQLRQQQQVEQESEDERALRELQESMLA